MRSLLLLTWLVCCALACTPASSPAPAAAPQPLVDGHFGPEAMSHMRDVATPPESPPKDETNRWANDPQAARFGQFLFFDKRLSSKNNVSCATCHQPDHGFSSTEARPLGQARTMRHPPGLINVAYNPWFDWDGKANTLWGQAMRPLESPDEHGLTRVALVQTVSKHPELRQAYERIFGPLPEAIDDLKRFPSHASWRAQEPESDAHKAWLALPEADRRALSRAASNIAKAIAAYQHKLVDFDAPFDRYARGLLKGSPTHAIPEAAKRGFNVFVGKGQCINCHNGPNFTDNTFHNLGLPSPSSYPAKDLGRAEGVGRVREHAFNAAGPWSDDTQGTRAQWLKFMKRTRENKGQFKTPSLRNTTVTFPYMHAGHFDGIRQVIDFYNALPGQAEVGHREDSLEALGLTDAEVDDLIAFLRTLTTDRMDPALLKQPASPLAQNP